MKKIILISTILLGSFLRLYNITNSPPSLNWDEAAWGYNAYSISKTGRDEYGVFLPIFTRSFDEYKSTLPLYLMIPSIKIFGLNEVGVRLPSALVGSVMILLIYLLTKKLWQSDLIALLSAFLIAIMPWSVHLSRVYHDANEALFFMILGWYLFLVSAKKQWLLPVSIISFSISAFTYNSNKIVVPLFVLSLLLLHKKLLKSYQSRFQKVALILGGFFAAVFAILAIKGQALARVESTNILRVVSSETTVLEKFYLYPREIVGRYIAYFSPANLFVREPLEPSTVLPETPLFYTFLFIFWVIGLWTLAKNWSKNKDILALLLIAPVPASLTWNWFQPGRGLALFTIFIFCIAIGINRLLNKKILLLAFVGYSLVCTIYLFDAINIQLPARDSGNWQPGFRETVPIVMSLQAQYKYVVIDTPHAQPYIFYLFYGAYDPQKYLHELNLEKIGTPRKVYDFGKFIFKKVSEHDKSMRDTLFVLSRESEGLYSLDSDSNFIQEIKDRQGNIIARLVGT